MGNSMQSHNKQSDYVAITEKLEKERAEQDEANREFMQNLKKRYSVSPKKLKKNKKNKKK